MELTLVPGVFHLVHSICFGAHRDGVGQSKLRNTKTGSVADTGYFHKHSNRHQGCMRKRWGSCTETVVAQEVFPGTGQLTSPQGIWVVSKVGGE